MPQIVVEIKLGILQRQTGPFRNAQIIATRRTA